MSEKIGVNHATQEQKAVLPQISGASGEEKEVMPKKPTNPVKKAIAEANRIQRKRDASKTLEDRNYWQWLLDAAVQDIIYLRTHGQT